jgi:leucyl-tRNA synthetase
MDYDFKSLEDKWQKRWESKKIFCTKSVPSDSGKVKKTKKLKFYCLEMFPYPSASGLHMGHAFNYTIGDVYSRFKRMQGFNVLYPMGFDAFGLPAENAAIKAHQHPRKYTENAIKNYIKQMKSLGLSYDWSKTLKTCDKEYYKWNQFFFLKFLEKGLVYKKKSPVNWCPKCKTVLANEQVHNGKCWRHEDTNVKTKNLEQWFIKTTAYAEELLNCIDDLEWPERIKIMQKNWIGKSYGTNIDFEIVHGDYSGAGNIGKWPIFTTRPDTIYGVTFMVVSAQHLRLTELVTKEQKKEVTNFLRKIKSVSEKEKIDLEKMGVFTGSYAINPLTNEKIPVWVGNFVLADYGSGMVMGVPAHDKRDFEFAKKYKIPIKQVIIPEKRNLKEFPRKIIKGEVYTGEGKLINSEQFNDLDNKKAMEEITKYLFKIKLGKKDIQYKLKDWLVSRQRYWGTPIPIVYCDNCGVVPVNEKDLPILLPEKVRFGEGNPLESAKNWVNTTCPNCKGKARRETDTMDTFFDSSWYFLRYCDNKNKKVPFDKKKVDYWMPVNQYIGGSEHACMHLIYARFFTKALRDLGFVNCDEPFVKLFNQGMLHGSDGNKMSKSLGNVELPEKVSEKYGIDTARLFLVSIASPDNDIFWSEKCIEGSLKFIKKIMNYFNEVKIGKIDVKIESKLNKTIKQVTNQIENFKYNLAIIKIRDLFNSLPNEASKEILEKSLKLLHPFCPHITEELWNKLGNKSFISLEKWPVVDEKKIDDDLEKQEKMIEHLVEDVNHIQGLVKKKISKGFIYTLPNEKDIYFSEIDLIKKRTNLNIEIFAVNDKQKYDPENKSKKAKIGKPAIYLE